MNSIRNVFPRINFHRIVHMAFLGAVVLIVATPYFTPQLLVVVYRWLSPFTEIVSLIPYVSWVVNESHTPQVTEAYLTLLYIVMVILFVNLYWSTYPHFSGVPSKTYAISGVGFALFYEENIYGLQRPSISLDRLGNLMFIAAPHPAIYQEKFSNFRDLFSRFLAHDEIKRFYIGMSLAGFIVFPWILHKEINSVALSILSFKFAALLMIYFQVRFLFETALYLGIVRRV